MPQNLPEQILQRIAKLSVDGNSQREVARVLGVCQGCISKILRRNRETGRPHQRKRGGSMKISTPREDRQLLQMISTNRFISAPRLRMQMIRRFGSQMSVRTIRRQFLAAGYWSRRPARCPRLTLEHRRRRREWGRRHRVWDLRQWRHCIFSDESRFSLYHSDGLGRVRRQAERLIDACVQPTDINRGQHTLLVLGSEGQYHVPPICSELFQCTILIFSLGAKCELGGCVLLAWLHTLPAYCHQFNDTVCICAAFSHIDLLPTNVKIVPGTGNMIYSKSLWLFQNRA